MGKGFIWILALLPALTLTGCIRVVTFDLAAQMDQIELMSEAYSGEAAVLRELPARLIDTQLRTFRQEGLLLEALTAGMAPVDATPVFPVEPIDRKAVNKRSLRGRTALHFACLGGNPLVVKALLDAGAKVNVKDAEGLTPLHIAASQNRLEAAELLLQAGAKVNPRTRQDWSAVALAARCGHLEMTQLLLDHGARASRDELWLDPALAELYCEKDPPRRRDKARNPLGESALELALLNGGLGRVKELLDFGTDVNHDTPLGLRPLHYAAASGSVELIQLLASAGADVYAPNKAETPLHVAARNGHAPALEALLQAGVDPAARGMSRTQVEVALPEGNWKLLVGELSPADQGWTALHMAAYYNEAECAELLLLAGAKWDAVAEDSFPETPLECAQVNQAAECGELLAAWSAEMSKKAESEQRSEKKKSMFEDILGGILLQME
ncbi:ankyrin repeat domain-containing protein [Candidatus Sumerlaeota bacterium]|nr:ankyrin repeat domain-containing protein [Candidatus Sumerlaeota bacterium]